MSNTTQEVDFQLQQSLDILKAQYEMNAKTLIETERRMKDQLKDDGSKMYTPAQIEGRLAILRDSLNDTVEQYRQIGGDVNDLTMSKKNKKRTTRTQVEEKESTKTNKKSEIKIDKKEKTSKMSYIPKKREFNNSVAFDVIPLPSKGQAYRNKVDRLQVAYLTANDENMFVSPNLYRDGLLIDYLLDEKVLDAGIDCGELLDGDRDAIVLWLRATGYGNEFPITATDRETGTEFEAVVDLSQIKFKEFNLESDERGWFTFELPMTKDEVKFKFLSHRELEELKKSEETESPTSVKNKLMIIADDLRRFLDNDESMGKVEKQKLYEACRNIEDWSEDIEDEGAFYVNTVTNRLEAQVMSVNGNTNRGFISEYVKNLNTRDSLALRKYINETEPGLDFNVEIEKPKSLGGGSQTVFLSFDQFIFLNIA